jgi:transcriptional regulator with XRE-family HTH domain
LERFTGTMRTEIYSEEHQKLRKILRRERRAAGLRQSDLAERTERSQAYISKFEKGDLRLDVVDFVRICTVIGCSVVDVLIETFDDQDNVKFRIGQISDEKVKLLLLAKEAEHAVRDVPNNPVVKSFTPLPKSEQRPKKH